QHRPLTDGPGERRALGSSADRGTRVDRPQEGADVPTTAHHEPLDLPAGAIRRIAEDAGADDENVARRILRAFEFSPECRAGDAGTRAGARRPARRAA